tara:strand:+ start:79022 stop:80287 length:1266 start_codon:yes stop_codon:yes gene_type:complete
MKQNIQTKSKLSNSIQAALTCSLLLLGGCADKTLVSAKVNVNEKAQVQSAIENNQLSMITVFNKNTVGEGYANFRIPALAVAQNGDLLAFAEGRRIRSDHTKGPLVLRRSEDGGVTWKALEIIVKHGNDSLNNPTPVVLENGEILVIYQRFPEGYHSRALPHEGIAFVEAGHKGAKVQTNHLISSEDNGKTWSAPIDITIETKRLAPVIANFTGPGPGLVMTKGKYAGRIIVPSCDFVGEGKNRVFSSYATYSDDQGKTWNISEHAANHSGKSADETQMVELGDGRLMMDVRAKGNRMIAFSSDGGESWSPLTPQADLPDSGAMGSVIRYELADGSDVLLHSGSTTRIKGRRSRGAVYASFDSGESWPLHKVYHPGSFDYSSIVRLPNGDIGILGEFDFGVNGKFNDIRFTRIKLDWLLSQ